MGGFPIFLLVYGELDYSFGRYLFWSYQGKTACYWHLPLASKNSQLMVVLITIKKTACVSIKCIYIQCNFLRSYAWQKKKNSYDLKKFFQNWLAQRYLRPWYVLICLDKLVTITHLVLSSVNLTCKPPASLIACAFAD